MRKLLLLSALVLIAASAFAQAAAPAPGLVLTGSLETGTIAQSYDAATPTLGIYDQATQRKSVFNLNGVYNAGSYGLYFRLREDDNWDQGYGTNFAGLRRVFGWTDLAGGLIRVTAGRVWTTALQTGDAGGYNNIGNFDGAVGGLLELKPIDGLDFGAFLPLTYGYSPGYATTKLDTSNTSIAQETLTDAVSTMAFGVKYTVKGLGDIEGGYWSAPVGTQNITSSKFDQYAWWWFGAEYTGTQNLTAILEGFAIQTRDAGNNSLYLAQKIGYQLGQIGLALYAEQYFMGNNVGAGTFGAGSITGYHGTDLYFRPVVDYNMGLLDVGVFAGVAYASSSNYSNNLGYSGGPFAQLNVGKGTYIKLTGEVGGGGIQAPQPGSPYELNYPTGSATAAYSDLGGWAPLKGQEFWQVNINFVYSF